MTQKQWNNHTHKQPTNKERNKQTNKHTNKQKTTTREIYFAKSKYIYSSICIVKFATVCGKTLKTMKCLPKILFNMYIMDLCSASL